MADNRKDERYKMLENWAENLRKRIMAQFVIQGIDPYNPTYKGTGRLYRRFSNKEAAYKIYNASEGQKEKIEFFYEYYSIFVEFGLTKGQPYNRNKLAKPYHEKEKYAENMRGVRAPKPFVFALLNQRVFALGKILEREFEDEVYKLLSVTLQDDGGDRTRAVPYEVQKEAEKRRAMNK